MCQEHERHAKAGSPRHPHCGHAPDGHSQPPGVAEVAEPDANRPATTAELAASPSTADAGGAM